MKYLIQIIFIFALAVSVFAKKPKVLSKEVKEQQRWNKILRLINQETATINKVKNKGQKLEYRLFELMSEKVKLYKEKENKKFVALKLKYGNKITRDQIFKETLGLYKKANAYGKALLRKYPNTRYKAAIYYTLALNSRDFAYDNNELAYLRKALEHSKNTQQVNYLARTSLAEYYYNNKQWKSAIYQYGIVLKNKDDEWYTKNLLNYSWCKLKNQDFKTAITSLEKSFLLSKQGFYVNVEEQAMKGLISFYVLGKEIERGIEFINKNATKKNESLLELARKSSSKGFFKEADSIALTLVKNINPTKKPELFADLKLFQFEMYDQYQKREKLLAVAKELPNIKLSPYHIEDAILKISKVVGSKQIILKKDYSKYNKDYDKYTLNEIISYFDILRIINTKKKHEYEYYQAETYYSVELFEKALVKYKTSLKSQAKKKVEVDLREKNLDALFSCIDLIDYKKSELRKDNELEFAFNTYLDHWPNSEKAKKIYPRLFALHLKTKNHPKMDSVLVRYIKHFPKELKSQQDLFKIKLDTLIKDNNTDLLATQINKMTKGFLKFKNKEIKKSETILANLLFSKFQEYKANGELKKALSGYQTVFYKESYPKSIRGESAFNMGMVYTDLQDNSNAFKWYRKSFKFMNKKEIQKKRVFLEKMSLRTALLHNFLNAAKLERFILHNFCKDKRQNTKNFKNAIYFDLANDYTRRALYTLKKYKKCVPSITNTIKEKVLDHLYQQKHELRLISFIDTYGLAKSHSEKVSAYYERLYWKYYIPNKAKSLKYEKLLSKISSKSTRRFFNSQRGLADLKVKIKIFSKQRVAIDAKKPNPQKFIQDLTQRINKLKEISDFASMIFRNGHGQLTILTYDELIKVSKDFAQEVSEYHIPINDQTFQKQFKSEMANISKNILNEVSNLKTNAQKLVEKYDLLLVARTYSDDAFDILQISDIRTPASNFGITIGLGKQ